MLNYASCQEMTLSLQEERATNEKHRLIWKTTGGSEDDTSPEAYFVNNDVDCKSVTLGPLDIRTFLLKM